MSMDSYGLDFLAGVEPLIVKDMFYNRDWFEENCNEILLNVGQPTKLEKDFLRHIEQVQQRKSDLTYRKILKNLELKRTLMQQDSSGQLQPLSKNLATITDHHSKGKRQNAT